MSPLGNTARVSESGKHPDLIPDDSGGGGDLQPCSSNPCATTSHTEYPHGNSNQLGRDSHLKYLISPPRKKNGLPIPKITLNNLLRRVPNSHTYISKWWTLHNPHYDYDFCPPVPGRRGESGFSELGEMEHIRSQGYLSI
jgi:hypothetical protein